MRPSLARRRLLVGYQKFALGQNGRVNDSDGHGEDERLAVGAHVSRSDVPPDRVSATFPRPRMTVRRTGPVWEPAGRDAGVFPSYHTGPGAAQGHQAEKARRQSTSNMNPASPVPTACSVEKNALAARRHRKDALERKYPHRDPCRNFPGGRSLVVNRAAPATATRK